jgi:predicted metalloprotease with PDZ domain
MIRLARALVLVALLALVSSGVDGQAPVVYRLSFPERAHRVMNVEITLDSLPAGPLQLRMSRSSPGRYALHEFAKNVFDVRVTDTRGTPLPVTRPDPHGWDVTTHPGSVRVSYKVFGDRIDGTYLSIDSSHAHVNMPAAMMWAKGLELRPATIRFEPPQDATWRVATQLFAGADPYTFTAPNLQYLMDSPTELSAFTERVFRVPDGDRTPAFKLAVHHDGSEADVDSFVKDVERIVREARHVIGEYPPFETNSYTFIADYLPWANGDAMEHRNSTVLSSPASIRGDRAGRLHAVAHEFWHVWNVERIRPKSLEPFNFEAANMSAELWLAEGVTNYYGPLIQTRAGVMSVASFAGEMGEAIDEVLQSPGRRIRSAEDMSRLAPFVDAATSIDRTVLDNTFISYYTWGSVIGIGLDLTLRDRSDGKVTLDHFMRELWKNHGKPGGRYPGYVDRPYATEDLKRTLALVSGDAAFADSFFSRFIQGREVVDFDRLLQRAGLLLQPVSPGQAFAGDVFVADADGRTRVAAAAPFGSPLYQAGLDRDDAIVSVGGAQVRSASDFEMAVRARKPGDRLPIVFERRGQRQSATIELIENPHRRVTMFEQAGRTMTEAQRQFRAAWLSSARNEN